MIVELSVIAIAAFVQTPAKPATVDSVWFRRVFARYDLTGDGRPDTFVVVATGKRVDSLRVDLTIHSAGHIVYHDEWLSTYYFQYDGPIDSIPETTKHAEVFKNLREILADSSFGPFNPADADGPDAGPQGTMGYSIAKQAAIDSLSRTALDEDALSELTSRYAARLKADSTLLDRAWRALVRRRPRTFIYFSGGEALQTIAWSAVLKRFVAVWGCC